LLAVSSMRDRLSWADMTQTFAANLRQLMGNATQQDIADKVGMSRTALNKILQGLVDPRLSTVQALADVLGKPIGELTGEPAETAGVSSEALRVAQMYDALDPEDRAFAWKFLRKLGAEPPSPQ
jgi:transcriptional regulator with XRE-family HTH domain